MKKVSLRMIRVLRFVLIVFSLGMIGMTDAFPQSQGAINGLFSISENQCAYFSRGNLQYQASTNTWRFAEHQWDYVGDGNANIAENYAGWIDLFGWATSGYEHGATCYQPWSSNSRNSYYYAYGSSNNNLYESTGVADWGYNAIGNGGNQENGGWRTLTKEEWTYLLKTRITASTARFAMANVNGVNGMILLPDDWEASYYSLNNINNAYVSYNTNSITSTQWNVLEQHGAVFLPAAGLRSGTSLIIVGNAGAYWSASYYNISKAYATIIMESDFGIDGIDRSYGSSVRLVRQVP